MRKVTSVVMEIETTERAEIMAFKKPNSAMLQQVVSTIRHSKLKKIHHFRNKTNRPNGQNLQKSISFHGKQTKNK